MNLRKLDLNLLITFEVIYNERSITNAAEVLNLTQPAVSNSLARLRAFLNDPLFNRVGNVMIPTKLAQSLIDPIRESLHIIEKSLQKEQAFNPEHAKIFRFSMGDITEATLLPPLIKELSQHFPQIGLQAIQLNREEIIRQMLHRKIDFAIDVPIEGGKELEYEKIISDKYVCVVRKEHPIIKQGISLNNYLALEHLHISSRSTGMGHIDIALHKIKKKRSIAFRVQRYTAAENIIKNSDLALSLPVRVAKTFDLHILELPFTAPQLELYLYWHTNFNSDESIKWMRNLLKELMGKI